VHHGFLWLVGVSVLAFSGPSFADDSSGPKHLQHFVRFTDCEVIEAGSADGDSFRARVDGHERVLRLYFVDAPESDTRFPQRNAEQAAYFGITSGESVEAGKAAKTYVRTLLAGKKLTVFTRWASALGSRRLPRYFAISRMGACYPSGPWQVLAGMKGYVESASSNNTNAVATLDTPYADPASEELRQKVNETLLKMRR